MCYSQYNIYLLWVTDKNGLLGNISSVAQCSMLGWKPLKEPNESKVIPLLIIKKYVTSLILSFDLIVL